MPAISRVMKALTRGIWSNLSEVRLEEQNKYLKHALPVVLAGSGVGAAVFSGAVLGIPIVKTAVATRNKSRARRQMLGEHPLLTTSQEARQIACFGDWFNPVAIYRR
jgi:hypothetical protein